MRLKSIKAHGFKSFADKIEVEVKDGITGIVGPNGSGKSNIVDAVRWVLGEQSVKALRGSNAMSDVIFQGSASRKPLNRASVTLVFDNSDRYLDSDFKEIEIKRIVYSTGENEYLLNNTKVRLKDITDLFLDSGAGKEAFSIISQGKIGEIINSKSEDRRAIIEEAAGVLKYKKRKVESLKKLEKTNDNLSKIDLVINELSTNLEPLREQKEKALKYNEYKNDLENIEISLLVKDITELNESYEKAKQESDLLRKDIEEMNSSNSKGDASKERIKLELLNIENEISKENSKLLSIVEELSNLEAEKQLIVERKKYEVDDIKLENNILSLKEDIKILENSKSSLEKELTDIAKHLEEIESKKNDLEVDLKKNNATKDNLERDIALKTRLLNETKNRIDIATSNLENSSLVPYSVKCILNNTRLKGIEGTFSSLIEVDPKYTQAIETTLGSMQNVLVAIDENASKQAINYLKDNKLGRATFFPMNIIKAKYIDRDTLSRVEGMEGFVGIASKLVSSSDKYRNIVENLLGNVIVTSNIDSLNRIAKDINYSYRVVSLDGEISHTGGSITGGSNKSSKNELSEKNNLKSLESEKNMLEQNLSHLVENLKKLEDEENIIRDNLSKASIKLFQEIEEKKNKEATLSNITNSLSSKVSELKGTEGIKNGDLDKELDSTIEKYYQKEKEKNEISSSLDKLKSLKSDLNTELSDIEMKARIENADYNKKTNELKDLEISLGKMDIKLDNLLLRLTDEYDITYERALNTYEITDDIEKDRGRVQTLRREIKLLGDVNLGSISEFERINTRYEFLTKQKIDLKESIDNLLEIISEMDATMEKNFKDTFDEVNREFKKVFSRLFKGGTGELVLTYPENLLETGVDIIAEPPGKKLKNITLLSGGEKTLTAIAFLFAILNVKTVPFCILDEVEAALDEANVDTFGTYLKEYKDKTQFIVITHKKKTMEYANTLYGITMQESGVSKLVSVKLEGLEKDES